MRTGSFRKEMPECALQAAYQSSLGIALNDINNLRREAAAAGKAWPAVPTGRSAFLAGGGRPENSR